MASKRITSTLIYGLRSSRSFHKSILIFLLVRIFSPIPTLSYPFVMEFAHFRFYGENLFMSR